MRLTLAQAGLWASASGLKSDTFIAYVGYERLPIVTPTHKSKRKGANDLVQHSSNAKRLKKALFVSLLPDVQYYA